jgi:serine/threonine protein kinase
VLGSGGFANVCCVTRKREGSDEPEGPELALKANRPVDRLRIDAPAVASEAAVLHILATAGVRGVPQVVDELTTAQWLVTTPVGEPLRDFLDKVLEEERQDAIVEVVREVHRTLCAAHAAGIVHGDVRPSNIVVVPSEDGSFNVVLVDWGISVSEGTPLHAGVLAYRRTDFGTPAYAEDDFTALGVTFLALWRGPPYSTPWEHAFTVEDMRAERAEWISDGTGGWGVISDDVKDKLPERVLAAILGLAARK